VRKKKGRAQGRREKIEEIHHIHTRLDCDIGWAG
jgi:hypothetical protein